MKPVADPFSERLQLGTREGRGRRRRRRTLFAEGGSGGELEAARAQVGRSGVAPEGWATVRRSVRHRGEIHSLAPAGEAVLRASEPTWRWRLRGGSQVDARRQGGTCRIRRHPAPNPPSPGVGQPGLGLRPIAGMICIRDLERDKSHSHLTRPRRPSLHAPARSLARSLLLSAVLSVVSGTSCYIAPLAASVTLTVNAPLVCNPPAPPRRRRRTRG